MLPTYLLAGQSNADGRGLAADLTGPLASYLAPRPDILLAYSDSGTRRPSRIPLTSNGFVPLAPGYSVHPSLNITALPSPSLGPELAMGSALAESFRTRNPELRIPALAVIKFAEGGTSLQDHWFVGPNLYPQMLQFVRQSLAALRTLGHTPDLRGLAWHQGESDAGPTRANAAYASLLSRLITQLRADLAAPILPVAIGQIADNGERAEVRAAQRAVASATPHSAFVPTDDLPTYDQGTHFGAAAQIHLGERFARALLALGQAQ